MDRAAVARGRAKHLLVPPFNGPEVRRRGCSYTGVELPEHRQTQLLDRLILDGVREFGYVAEGHGSLRNWVLILRGIVQINHVIVGAGDFVGKAKWSLMANLIAWQTSVKEIPDKVTPQTILPVLKDKFPKPQAVIKNAPNPKPPRPPNRLKIKPHIATPIRV